MRSLLKIIALFLLSHSIIGCHPEPRDVRQAAQEALEKGRIQMDSGHRAEAMRYFKEAELFASQSADSLMLAWAWYEIGRSMSLDGQTEGVADLLKAADKGFNEDVEARSKALAVLGAFYQLHREFDSAEICLNQGLALAEQSGSEEALQWILSAYYVKCFNAKEYERSANYLNRYLQSFQQEVDDELWMYYYHNMGNVFFVTGQMDSAAYYYGQLEALLPKADETNDKNILYYYGALVNLAEAQGDFEKACLCIYPYLKAQYLLDKEKKENNIELVRHQFDDEVAKNVMNGIIIRNQHIIIIISIVSALVLAAFLFSQVRLARRRKREADINAELFHFKQQSQALAQKDAEHEQIQKDYADRLSEALDKEQQTMMLLDIYLNNSKKANLLNDLERSVFGDKDHWKAMLAVVEEKYPSLWETLGQKYPDLDEDEKKSFILSHFKVSRQEEADYLGTTVNMVDKLRGRWRKKMEKE